MGKEKDWCNCSRKMISHGLILLTLLEGEALGIIEVLGRLHICKIENIW